MPNTQGRLLYYFLIQLFKEGLSTENWPRFQYYSLLVKTIQVDIVSDTNPDTDLKAIMHPDTILLLHTAAVANGTSVLPRVEKLDIVPYGPPACERVILLVPDVVSDLMLNWCWESPRTLAIILQRVRQCHQLTKFRLETDDAMGMSPFVCSMLAQAIASLKSLRNLRIATDLVIQPRVWHALQNLPCLAEVSASEFPTGTRATVEPLDQLRLDEGFAHMKNLSLRVSHIELCKLLNRQATAPIETTRFRVFDALDEVSIDSITRHISGSLLQLRSLTLILDCSSVNVGFEALSHLAQLEHLHTLHISSDGPCGISDEEWRTFSRSWPQLRSLQICPDPIGDAPACATLLALGHIAGNCPLLEDLALHISTDLGSLPSFSITMPPFSKQLRGVSFGLSSVSDTALVAQHLLRLLQRCQPTLMSYELGKSRSGRIADALVKEKYLTAQTSWEGVMLEVTKLRPFVIAIQEAAEVENALLKVEVSMLNDRIAILEKQAGLGRL